MFTTSKYTRAAAFAAAGLGAVAAAVVSAAPAGAAVSSIAAQPGLGGGFGTTCSYDVRASATGTKLVLFTDNGVPITGGGIAPSGGVATANWTPTTPGTHILRARQGLSVRTVAVTVGHGLNLGSLCLVS